MHLVVFSSNMRFIRNQHAKMLPIDCISMDPIITSSLLRASRIFARSITKNHGSIFLNSLKNTAPSWLWEAQNSGEPITNVVAKTTLLRSGCRHWSHAFLHQSFRLAYFPTYGRMSNVARRRYRSISLVHWCCKFGGQITTVGRSGKFPPVFAHLRDAYEGL